VQSAFAAIDHPKNKYFGGSFAGETDSISKVERKILVGTSTPRHSSSGDTLQTGRLKHKSIPTMSAEQGQPESQVGQAPTPTPTTLAGLKYQRASLTERLDALWEIDTFTGAGRPHDEMIRRMVVQETLINSHNALLEALEARISMLERGGDERSPEYAALEAEHHKLLAVSCLEEANHESVFRDEVTHNFKFEAMCEQSEPSEQSGKITIATFECHEKK